MKLISFVVPSYNSEKYLDKCISSLLPGGDDVEIIIVNDGSSDNTLKIANDYKNKYPNIVRVIDKENGGHGSGVNAGIENATGLYFKVVDSDDWVNNDAYMEVLSTIRKHIKEGTSPDMYLTNYVFERIDSNKQFVADYKNRIPTSKMITFDDIKTFGVAEFMIMHSIIYKLDIVKKSGVRLPEHTFYVDTIFTFVPLKLVKSIYYIDCDFYRYYVGRPDQSVTFENMTKNYGMQIRVMYELSIAYSWDELKALPKKQRNFMIHDLIVKSYLTLFYVMAGYNKEKKKAYKAYFSAFRAKNKSLYYKLRYRTYFLFPFCLVLPLRRMVVMAGYKKLMSKTNWN